MKITLDIPSHIARHVLDCTEDDPQDFDRIALESGVQIRRGRGYVVRLEASLATHQGLLSRAWVLSGGSGMEASASERRAYRTYEQRIQGASRTV